MPDDDQNDDGQNDDGQDDQSKQGQQDQGTDWKAEAEKWKDLSRKHEQQAKANSRELDKLRTASMSDQDKAVEEARKAAREEAATAFNRRLVQAEVRAAAAGKLADPEDAIRFLDLEEFAVDSEGDVDKKAVAAAVARLVKEKPYLTAGATRPTGDADQGTRRPAAGSSNDWLRSAIANRR